jgi:hypothetical protein
MLAPHHWKMVKRCREDGIVDLFKTLAPRVLNHADKEDLDRFFEKFVAAARICGAESEVVREWRDKLGGEVKFLRAYKLAMVVCHGRVQSIILSSALHPRENSFHGLSVNRRTGTSMVPAQYSRFRRALNGQNANFLRFDS